MTLMKELHKIIEYKFIDKESKLYDSAIDLRYREFYETSNRAKEAIFDEFEDKSMRIVAYIEEKVIGHARLFVHDSIGEVTQVVVDHEYRGMKIGVGIMNKLIEKAKEIKVQHITLDARVYAVEFYKRFGFETKGQEYISLKTGMPIIKMVQNFTYEN
ncbi:GNAT family N-acetyltransferase [Clostridium butyricum]|nr:GNAT family N-acetyltransferase [Clostridium butyricum]